jgi:hypothetical protein
MPIESPSGATFDDFSDCVNTISGDGTSEESAKRICGAWEGDKNLSQEVITVYVDHEGEITIEEAYELALNSAKEIPDKLLEQESEQFFVPTSAVAEDAQKALDWKEKHGDEIDAGADDGEGWRRARQLVEHHSNDEPLEIEFWEEIRAFHARHHAQDNHLLNPSQSNRPYLDSGYLSHLTWGGDAGYEQAKEVMELVEEVEQNE